MDLFILTLTKRTKHEITNTQDIHIYVYYALDELICKIHKKQVYVCTYAFIA